MQSQNSNFTYLLSVYIIFENLLLQLRKTDKLLNIFSCTRRLYWGKIYF